MKIVPETIFDELIVNSLPGIFYVIDREGRLIQWNRNLEIVTGFSAGAISRKSLPDFFPSEDKEFITGKINEGFKKGFTRLEARLLSKSGKRIPYIFAGTLSVIRGQEYFIGEALDITERKRRTLELAEANSFLKNIISSSPTGILIYDSDGQCLSVSDSAGPLVGASKEQLLAQNFRGIESWKRSGLLEAAEATLATGKVNRKAVHLTTTFGKEIWIDYQFARFYTADEPHLLLMFTDIKDLIKTEEALSESEAKYRQLLEGANDAIFVADAETGILIDANKKATELIGKPLEKIIGMHQSKLHPKDEAENISRIFKEQVIKGAGIAPEINVINGDGERIPVEVSTSVMEYRGRTIIQGIFRNISERKQSEKAIFEKDRQIRKAYVDVLGAVTGGRLIIMDDTELVESLGNPLSSAHRIGSYRTLASARKNLNATIEANKTASDHYHEFVFAANEALANAVKHGVNGRYQVLRRNGIIQVLISDNGPGIDFSILPKATLVTGFSTKQSLGMGFSIMLDVCDKVLLSTRPGKTSLVLEKAIS